MPLAPLLLLRERGPDVSLQDCIRNVLAVGEHGCHNAPLHGFPAQPETNGFVEVGALAAAAGISS